MYQKILVCLDGSATAELILPEIEKLVTAHPAEVILLQVGSVASLQAASREMNHSFADTADVRNVEYDMLNASMEMEMRAYLDHIGARFKALGSKTAAEVSFNDPASEILHYARFHNVDLIAMVTHGRTGLNRFLHGSVTEDVLEHATCPVLVVRSTPNDAASTR